MTYKELVVWQKSLDLVVLIYTFTENFPKSEIYGLTSQMRRAAVSISSNIAEGKMRGTRKDFRHFLLNAFGSGAELETQLEIVHRLPFGKSVDVNEPLFLLTEIMKMLNKFIYRLEAD